MYFNQFWSILLSDLIEKGIYYRKKRLKEKVTSSFYMLVCLPWDIWRDLVFVATAFVFKRHLRNLIHRAELTFICWKNSSHIMRNARKTWCECEFFCVQKNGSKMRFFFQSLQNGFHRREYHSDFLFSRSISVNSIEMGLQSYTIISRSSWKMELNSKVSLGLLSYCHKSQLLSDFSI